MFNQKNISFSPALKDKPCLAFCRPTFKTKAIPKKLLNKDDKP